MKFKKYILGIVAPFAVVASILSAPMIASAISVNWNRTAVGTEVPQYAVDGILVTASSTIGNGTQAGGLTVNGGATTTQKQVVDTVDALSTTATSSLPYLSVSNAIDIAGTYITNFVTAVQNALSSWTGSTSITTVGTLTSGTWHASPIDLASYVTGTLPIGNGGTGQTSNTKGDLLAGSGSAWNKLGVGTDGQVLTASSTATNGVAWEDTASGGGSTTSSDFTAGESISVGDAVALGTYQSDGGITYYNKAQGSLSGTGSTRSFGFDVGSGSNRFLIVCIDSDTNGVSGANYNSISMTDDGNLTGASRKWHCFSQYSPTSGSNTVQITGVYTGGGYTIQYIAYAYQNVKQTSGYTVASQLYSNVGSFSKSITPTTIGDLDVALVGTNATNGTQSMSYPTQHSYSQVGNPYLFSADTGILSSTASFNIAASRTAGTIDWEVFSYDLHPYSAVSSAAYKADADSSTASLYQAFIGFASTAATAGNPVSVTTSGIATGLSGLSQFSQYYISNTAGAISTSAGSNSRKACIATSATECLVTNIW